MRVEITREINLTEEQEALLDVHTFINVIAVVTAQLQALGLVLGNSSTISHSLELAFGLKQALPRATTMRGAAALEQQAYAAAPAIRNQVARAITSAQLTAAQLTEGEMIRDAVFAATEVLERRTSEYAARMELPPRWLRYDPITLRGALIQVLAAIEANAMGRYRIVFGEAEHDADSYLVHLDISSSDAAGLLMPAVLHDVLRDLVANARKYTPPGGILWGVLNDDGHAIEIEVRDNGRGIPHREIQQVVGFGYRAHNVLDTHGTGTGFGLTKAYVMTKRFGGRMWIDSEIGRGTVITCRIPRPLAETERD